MAKRINLALLNIIVVLSFILLLIFMVRLDFQNFYAEGGTAETFQFWYYAQVAVEKTINIIISSIAIFVYLGIAFKYRTIKAKLNDKYMANLLSCSLLYQGISRALEIYYMVSESSLHYFIYVVTKFYLPLDILSVVFLSIVAISGFLIPANSESKRFERLNQVMLGFAIGGMIIGILITVFPLFESDSLFIIITVATGILLFLVIIILIILTCFNIFRSWSKMQPFRAMGLQLILGVLAILLLIVSELGFEMGLSYTQVYICKDIKNGAFLLIGILYYYSIIKPGKEAMI
jgi:hypothetical protein